VYFEIPLGVDAVDRCLAFPVDIRHLTPPFSAAGTANFFMLVVIFQA